MNNSSIDFQWAVDSAGYELTPDQQSIRRKGGAMVPYAPAKKSAIHRQFAALSGSPTAMLAFVQQYGFLGSAFGGADVATESIAVIKAHWEKLASFHLLYGADDWSQIELTQADIDGFNEYATAPHMILKLQHGDRGGDMQVRAMPLSLGAWMWLALAQEMTGEVAWRRCERPGCGGESGPNFFALGRWQRTSGKRMYCSDACRVAARRLQLKKGKS